MVSSKARRVAGVAAILAAGSALFWLRGINDAIRPDRPSPGNPQVPTPPEGPRNGSATPASVPPSTTGRPVHVRVRDWRGRPVADADLALLPGSNDPGSPGYVARPPLARGRTDVEGKGRLEGPASGTAWLRAAAAGFCAVEEMVDIEEGVETPVVEAILLPGCTIEGRVRTAVGAPVPGVRVLPTELPWSVPATTDADGRYRLEALPPGQFALAVILDGGVTIGTPVLQFPTVRRYDIVLPASCTLRFHVAGGPGGLPIAGAKVTASVSLAGERRIRTWMEGTTDKGGSAVFRGLPEGPIEDWKVEREGLVAAGRERNVDGPTLSPILETVVEVALPVGGRISGTVRSGDGTPVPGAWVGVSPESPDGSDWLHHVSGKSGEDGRYAFSGVLAGACSVSVSHPSFLEGEDQRIAIVEGLETGLDLVLQAGAVVEGTVEDGFGRPVPGLAAAITDKEDEARIARALLPSDAAGKFRIEGVPPGVDYRVEVSGPEGVTGESGLFPVHGTGAPPSVRVIVRPGATVCGRITVEEGSIPKGAWVFVPEWAFGGFPYPTNTPWGGGARAAAVADDGTFRLQGLAPGRHHVAAAAVGFLPGRYVGVEVAAGEVLEGVEVKVEPEAHLRGRVVDSGGKGLEGAEVQVQWHRPDWLAGDRDSSEYGVRACSGEDGRFSVGGLYRSDYDVLVRLDGWFEGKVLGTAGGEEAVVVLHRTGTIAGVVVAAETGTPLPGLPLRARQQTGYLGPIHDVNGVTGPDGSFRLQGLDGARTCDLLVGRESGHDPGTGGLQPEEVQDVPIGKLDLRVKLSPGLSISGRVVDDGGKPVEGRVNVRVVLDNPWGGEISTLYRDGDARPDGTFVIAGLPKGKYTVSAWRNSSEFPFGDPSDLVRADVEGIVAGSTGLELRLLRGVYISGQVVTEEGGAPEDGSVYCLPVGASLKSMERDWGSIRGGRFSLGPVLPGREYDLVTRHCSGWLSARVSGIAGGSRDVVIRVKRAGKIVGTVLDPDGRPAGEGVVVRAIAEGVDSNESGAYGWEKTSPGGGFTFEDLGPYRFRLYAGGTSPTEETPDYAPVPSEPMEPGVADVVLKTRVGIRLSGRLVDGARKAREVFHVIASQPGIPGLHEYNQPEADHSFTLIGLVPGRVVLSAQTRFGEPLTLGEFDIPVDDLTIPVGGK